MNMNRIQEFVRPVVTVLVLLLPSFVVAQDKGKTAKSADIRGAWTLDAKRTAEFAKSKKRPIDQRILARMKGMSLELKTDDKFVQQLGKQFKITGKWKFVRAKKTGDDRAQSGGKLTLDPDNLGDDHEDMVFQIVFITKNVIKAVPNNGTATIFFSRKPSNKKRR